MPEKKLAQGYTTGTCAQAATKAALQMLFTGRTPEQVKVRLPGGSVRVLDVCEPKSTPAREAGRQIRSASCAVRKDSGDDPDITDGVLVFSTVEKTAGNQVVIDGGEGIGRVTKPGLDQPVGAAAINRTPRQMILKEVKEACEEVDYTGGIRVVIAIPGGEKLAEKTFNPRLGIEGGLSVLGTSGIVEPMSEQALVDTIRVEIRVKLAQGRKSLVAVPGNYGQDFLASVYGIGETDAIKCSNYIGQTIDMAAEEGCRQIVFAGHIGKLVKVAGGIMNTHSKWADCRMELMAAAALQAQIPSGKCRELLTCVTTDDALDRLTETQRRQMMEQLTEKIEKHLAFRAPDGLKTGAVLYSGRYGILGKTRNAEAILEACLEENRER